MEINIGIIGYGVIGEGVVKIIHENSKLIENRTGIKLNIKKVADLDLKKKRSVELEEGILTFDANEILENPEIDIVVELIGGYEPARKFILKALENKKHVVTANKAVIAKHCKEIFESAEKNNVQLKFEASVAGCIPIIRSLQQSYASEKINSIYGILNGTTNYILTRIREGMSYEDALKKAQEFGFAERDPSFDVEGKDAAQKLVILATLVYNTNIKDEVYTEGITHIEKMDMEYSNELGYVIKLLAIARFCNNEITLRVHPTMIPKNHQLSSVNNELNAVYVVGRNLGNVMFYGRGAGQLPTATVIVGDIIDIAKNKGKFSFNFFSNTPVKNIDSVKSRYYLRCSVVDKPGVLAKIAEVLGRNKISLAGVWQKEENKDFVPLVMTTHEALEKDIRKAIDEINRLDVINGKAIVIRIEDFS